MEALTALAGNGIWSLIAVIAIIVIFLVAIKKGILSFRGHGLQIGEQISRDLIRNQWEYAQSACEAQFSKIRPYCESDSEAKYLIAKVNDIFQAAIIYNFMSENESYLKAKQTLVLNAVRKRGTNSHFHSAEFEACCNRFVEETIKALVRMKKISE